MQGFIVVWSWNFASRITFTSQAQQSSVPLCQYPSNFEPGKQAFTKVATPKLPKPL